MNEIVSQLVWACRIEAAHRNESSVGCIVSAEINEVAVYEADIIPAGKGGELGRQLLRGPVVIAVQNGDEVALHLLQPCVSRSSCAQPGRLDDPEFRRLQSHLL
jgi:hypothetical protein